jgi:predicted esterase
MTCRSTLIAIALVAVLLLPAVSATAKDDGKMVPEVETPGEVKRGRTGLFTTEGGVVSFLRVPKSYDRKKGTRLIVFLHGSNMNGLSYVRSFQARQWCKDDLLLCVNGEQGDDPYGANNFTFSSAPKVAEATKVVADAFTVTRTYVGGHSQGGFLTFSVIMHFPEQYQGAFPMAGDCWSQNEPNLWEGKPEILAKQKKIAIAVIHGRADPVVKFSQGEHAYDVFNVMAWPALTLFAPARLGHQFMLSPVAEALDWLDVMVGDDAKASAKAAEGFAKKKEWGDALAAARRAQEIEGALTTMKKRAGKVILKAEDAAEKMKKAMSGDQPADWLLDWYAFRRKFGGTNAAKGLEESYDARRKEQRVEGARLFRQAFGLIRGEQKEKGYELLEDLLEKAPYSYDAYYAVKWLANRK